MGAVAVGFDTDRPTAAPISLDPDALLTAEEVAAILRVTPRWVADAGRSGRLPSVRLGRFRLYRRAAIVEWIERLEA